MATKKTKTKKSTPKKNVVPGSKALKGSPEVFCRLYAGKNSMFFNNGKKSYMTAYGYTDKVNDLKDQKRRAEYKSEEYNDAAKALGRMESNIESHASRLLRNDKVLERIGYLLDQYIADYVVDRELSKVIMQDQDLKSKVSAISEYNKVKERSKGNITGELVIKWEDD